MPIKENNSSLYKIEEYNFEGFEDVDHSVKSFSFQDFKEMGIEKSITEKLIPQKMIRKEREAATKTKFEVNSDVSHHRGLQQQAADDYEKNVADEVERRLAILKEEGIKDGFNVGKTEGHDQAYNEAKDQFSAHVEELTQVIAEVKTNREEILTKNRDDIYKMIRNLTKWVLLKETDDIHYLERLLEKLILELNQKANILIKVNAGKFNAMEGVVELIESKVGELSNVRIELDQEMNETGIILESEGGIIDGSLESQFKSIDKIFESVGIINVES
jgi:flagellar assembly protein FliH